MGCSAAAAEGAGPGRYALRHDRRRGAADRRLQQGDQQRIKLAPAIAHDPKVLPLDEPLNGLDPLAPPRSSSSGGFAADGRTWSSRLTSCTRSTSSGSRRSRSRRLHRRRGSDRRSPRRDVCRAPLAVAGALRRPFGSRLARLHRGSCRRGADRLRTGAAARADRKPEQFYVLLDRLAGEGGSRSKRSYPRTRMCRPSTST